MKHTEKINPINIKNSLQEGLLSTKYSYNIAVIINSKTVKQLKIKWYRKTI